MADAKAKKPTGQTSAGAATSMDELIPPGCSQELRQKIIAEKDQDKKSLLIALAWDEAGAAKEPEFVSQSRKKSSKPKPAGGSSNSNANGSHSDKPRRTDRPAGGSKPTGEGKRPASAARNGAVSGADSGKTAASVSNKTAIPSSSAPSTVSSSATGQSAQPATTAAPATKPKSTPSAVPSQSAWATGTPLSQKLSAKPEEEKREQEEKARAAAAEKQRNEELARQKAATAAADDRKKKEQVPKQQNNPSSTNQAEPAPAQPPAETTVVPPVTSYLSRAKGVHEKKTAAAPTPQKPATPPATQAVQAPAATSPAAAQQQPVAQQAAAPRPQAAAPSQPVAPQQPVASLPPVTLPSAAPVETAPVLPVRVPEGFGASGLALNFGDFGVEASGVKFGAPANAASAWDDSSKKSNDAANSTFMSNLMAGAATSASTGMVSAPQNVNEVESKLMSTGTTSAAPETLPAADAPVIMPAANAASNNTSAGSSNVNSAPQSTNPLMMNPSFQRAPNSQMPGPMPNTKKGGRGPVVPGRGGALGAAGMRHPGSYPVDHYSHYQPEYAQGGFGMPYGQAPSFAADPMFPPAAQYGYGNDMGAFYQQQQQQQQQQPQQASGAGAPPGLSNVSNLTSTAGEYSTSASQSTADIGNSNSTAPATSGSHSSSQQHVQPQQQGGYFPYSYGAPAVNQQHVQQQGTQQQQLPGAGSVGGASQEPTAYPGSAHPTSFSGAASAYPPPMTYPYAAYGSQNYYYPQYPSYPSSNRYATAGFPQPMQYGQAPLPQDQQRQTSGTPYYGQGLSTGASSVQGGTGESGSSVRGGPPGYGPSFAAQQQQHPSSEASWSSQQQQQQDNYQYRSAANYYNAPTGSTGQDWRRQ